MTYAELKTAVMSYMHRGDLVDEIPQFIDNARIRINRRFNAAYPALVNDTDTNELLAQYADMYLYAALVDGYNWTQNGPAADTYDGLYAMAADAVNVQDPGNPVDAGPLTIKTEPYTSGARLV